MTKERICNQCHNPESDHYYEKDGETYSKYRHIFMPECEHKKHKLVQMCVECDKIIEETEI